MGPIGCPETSVWNYDCTLRKHHWLRGGMPEITPSCKLQITVLSCLSVRLSPTKRIFEKYDIGNFYENLSRKSGFCQNRTTVSGTLHEDPSALTLLTAIRNVPQLGNSAMETRCILLSTRNTLCWWQLQIVQQKYEPLYYYIYMEKMVTRTR
jgi:hypothetical protein